MSDAAQPILRVENIGISFGEKNVLNDVSASLYEGELVSLLGASGGGKTTLFNIISGLQIPDTGKVMLRGADITGSTGQVSYMMQKDLLLESMKVADNVALPLRLRGMSKHQAYKEACDLLPTFGLKGTEDFWPAQLSGGMRQRAALARTYLFSNEVFLLDEPFSALDALTKAEMHAWFLSMQQKLHLSVLFVTHDIDEAVLLSDRVLVLSNGRIAGKIHISQTRPRTTDFSLQEEFLDAKRQVLSLL